MSEDVPDKKDDRPFYIGVALVIAVGLVFGRVLRHPFIPYDDDWYLYANPYVQQGFTLESLRWAFTATGIAIWHPVTLLSHILDWQIFGPRAGLHHAVSVVLHGANAVLLFRVLLRMTGALWPCAIAAAFFALHPMHVESVAWASERKDVLSTFFMLLSLWAYAAYGQKGGALRYTLVAVTFALGLMAKSMLVTLPFVFLLLDGWPLKRWGGEQGKSFPALVVEKIPLFVLSALFIVVTLLVQPAREGLGIPLGTRLAHALAAYGWYLYKLVNPTELAILYPYSAEAILLWKLALSAIVLLGITALVLARLRKQPYLAVGWFWYLGALVPVSGIVQIADHAVADRYTYVPYMGLFVALCWWGYDLCAKRAVLRMPLAGASVLALLACAGMSFVQAGYWRDGETLFKRALAVTSGNVKMHNNLGVLYMGQNRFDEARAHFEEALRVNGEHTESNNNLGAALLSLGEPAAAEQRFRTVLEARPQDPTVHLNLAVALSEQGRNREARTAAEEALAIEPNYGLAQQFMEQLPKY